MGMVANNRKLQVRGANDGLNGRAAFASPRLGTSHHIDVFRRDTPSVLSWQRTAAQPNCRLGLPADNDRTAQRSGSTALATLAQRAVHLVQQLVRRLGTGPVKPLGQ